MAAVRPLGSRTLDADVLRQDRKTIQRFDQWGLGSRAVYVNSKWRPRAYYIPYESITHIFRRVAVSPGTGKAFLTPILYLVIRYDDGKEFQETFKYIDAADRLMNRIEKEHPHICLMSPAGEQKQKERAALDERVNSIVLPDGPRHEVTRLENARWTLEKRPALTNALAGVSRIKRSVDNIKPVYQRIAAAMMVVGAVLLAAGAFLQLHGSIGSIGGMGSSAASGTNGTIAAILALSGIAILFVMGNSRVLPTPRRNRKRLQADYDKALADMERYLKGEQDFPIPARYAHPYVCTRMIRILKEERAENCEQALEVLKEDLRRMDNTVALTGDDYTQVVTIKPLFLVTDYQ